jgi:hypothetical protein
VAATGIKEAKAVGWDLDCPGAMVGTMKTLDKAQPSFILSQPLPSSISAINSYQQQSNKNGNSDD